MAQKAKQKGLTAEEKEEQAQLRQEYIQSFRSSFKSNLMGLKVIDPTGRDVTPDKLKKEQQRYKKQH
ncbi:uncharacterized protein YnzC (UPF0291/DUF896 family) [Caldalkalibacillus uzonensis]|uniref:Uncharacterized protein YnzC (UPF0291/DUF896 family) n=1 Tax=Caldalkalibacillus uzonensis TaxID=353224 RepID=A0ABU0CLT8_9BACI|nr:uncharacterized protein YnzC (UPF0291/DUF896 family) [Caldalkalibacillus uzonensis]